MSKKIGRDMEENSESITVFYQFRVSEDKGGGMLYNIVWKF